MQIRSLRELDQGDRIQNWKNFTLSEGHKESFAST